MRAYIEMYLEDFNMNKKELAIKMDITDKKLSEILSDKARLSASDAYALSKAFGTTSDLWLSLQNNIDVKKKEKEIKKTMDKVGYRILVDEKILDESKGIININNQLTSYYGVSQIQNIIKLYESRTMHAYKTRDLNPKTLVWLRQTELKADAINIEPFVKNEFKFDEVVNDILMIWSKQLPFEEKMNEVKNRLFSSNIALVTVPYISGSSISAFTSYVGASKKLTIHLSDMYKRSSNLLFAIIHELIHVKKHLLAKGFKKYTDAEEKKIDLEVGNIILKTFDDAKIKPDFWKSCNLWRTKERTRDSLDIKKYKEFKSSQQRVSFKGGLNG